MRRWAARAAGVLAGVVFALLLVGCGGPDTEGQTLAEARQTLADAGVAEENITLTGAGGAADADPNDLPVCDQEPDAASAGDDVTLEVATTCLEEDDDGRKRRSFGGRRGRR